MDLQISKLLIISFLSLLFHNCGGKKSIKSFYDNGNVKTITEVKEDTIKDGNWKAYYIDGSLRGIGQYRENKIEGKFIMYYPDGVVQQEINYLNNKRHGKTKNFDSLGRLISSIEYKNHLLDGQTIYYYPTGQIKEIDEYISDTISNITYFNNNVVYHKSHYRPVYSQFRDSIYFGDSHFVKVELMMPEKLINSWISAATIPYDDRKKKLNMSGNKFNGVYDYKFKAPKPGEYITFITLTVEDSLGRYHPESFSKVFTVLPK